MKIKLFNKLKFKNGFTLIEIMISLLLLSVLLSLLSGMLYSMMKLSNTAESVSGRQREVAFCLDLMRKELGEIVVNNNDSRLTLLAGEDFLSYATTRQELVARDSIPRGLARVEWRFDRQNGNLIRKVFQVPEPGRIQPPETETRFLSDLKQIEIGYLDDETWRIAESDSFVIPKTRGISIVLRFNNAAGNSNQKSYSSSFLLYI